MAWKSKKIKWAIHRVKSEQKMKNWNIYLVRKIDWEWRSSYCRITAEIFNRIFIQKLIIQKVPFFCSLFNDLIISRKWASVLRCDSVVSFSTSLISDMLLLERLGTGLRVWNRKWVLDSWISGEMSKVLVLSTAACTSWWWNRTLFWCPGKISKMISCCFF